MATTEPIQPKEIPVQNEGTAEEKVTPVKEVKQNGQDGDSSDVSPAKSKSENQEEKGEDADNHETDEQGQDEADQEMEPAEEKTKEEDDDEDEDESSDDEPQKGSFDGPVEIMTGKRQRKKVERLAMQSPPPEKKKKIKVGRGVKLGDCPVIEFQLGKTNTDLLKPLHRILFGRIGKVTEIKKRIRKFSGFPFTKGDLDFKKREIQLTRYTLAGLKELCTWLDLEQSGTKEDIMQRILEFCLVPVMSEKKMPVKKKKAPKKTATKRKKASAKADAKGDAKGDAKKKKKKKVSKSKASLDEDDVEEEDEIIDEDEDSDVEEEEPKKKKAKKETPKTPKSPKKPKTKTPQKKSSPKKSTPKKSAAKVEDPDSDSSSDDDAPLSKKSNTPPAESEIRTVITKFLDGANLEQVTMKTVCKKVYETYPEFDLTHKKDFIKSTVKEIIST